MGEVLKVQEHTKEKRWVAGYAHHICPRYKGSGQALRFGRKFLLGEPVPPHKR
jgi:hypothetical protein